VGDKLAAAPLGKPPRPVDVPDDVAVAVAEAETLAEAEIEPVAEPSPASGTVSMSPGCAVSSPEEESSTGCAVVLPMTGLMRHLPLPVSCRDRSRSMSMVMRVSRSDSTWKLLTDFRSPEETVISTRSPSWSMP
jgi:hypothetical protein